MLRGLTRRGHAECDARNIAVTRRHPDVVTLTWGIADQPGEFALHHDLYATTRKEVALPSCNVEPWRVTSV